MVSMDSPSAQLVDPSMIDVDGPPSSPFVTEIDHNSRMASKQWDGAMFDDIVEEDTAVSPLKQSLQSVCEDKENVPESEATATIAKIFASPKKPSTPERPPSAERALKSIQDTDMMPPPSTRKASVSPRKTPRKTSRNGTNTPRSISRANSHDRTPGQNPAAFQAGLDVRNTMVASEDQMNVDDTCFSTFSEIPDMTVFAKLGQSPTKRGDMLRTPRGNTEATPRTSRKRSSISRSPSPTPRRQKTPAAAANGNETGSFLIDFTQQLEGIPPNFTAGSPSKSQTEADLLQYIHKQRSPNKSTSRSAYNTPNKNPNLLNLLDFDLQPAATPRSLPTITVRELESLKSSYLSQISSLKATLSGREAEVDSLKKAVGDAERRVGEAQESLRDERSKREHLEHENESWKKRGTEFESVLKRVKEEVIKSEAEKEETHHKLEDAEKRVSDAEARAIKAEERFADALAARGSVGEGGDGNATEEQVQRLVSAQIDAKIESVSRELHAVYKEKHERKVATLKKSYEARNEKKTAELQARVTDLEKSNEELQAAKDATFSGTVPHSGISDENVELKAQVEEQRAALARLESEMTSSKSHQKDLEMQLEAERIEKGDLVAAVDEMLALQAEAPPPATPQDARARSVVEDFRKSISRPPSGLRAPGAGGRGLPALNRSTSGGVGKSKILANIERMGRTGSASSGLGGLE